MFTNCLWFIEQAWETVFKPFTMKICEELFGFLLIVFERQGPEKGTFLFLLSLYYTTFDVNVMSFLSEKTTGKRWNSSFGCEHDILNSLSRTISK
jgi:hypothetical protein